MPDMGGCQALWPAAEPPIPSDGERSAVRRLMGKECISFMRTLRDQPHRVPVIYITDVLLALMQPAFFLFGKYHHAIFHKP